VVLTGRSAAELRPAAAGLRMARRADGGQHHVEQGRSRRDDEAGQQEQRMGPNR
jgi:hypothetical protein